MSNLPVLELGTGTETEPPVIVLETGAQPVRYDLQECVKQAEKTDASLVFENLTPEEQAHVKAFIEKINVEDSQVVMTYGAAAQNKIAQFSDNVLQSVKTHDTGAAGKSLANLVVEIKGFTPDLNEKPTGLFAKLRSGTKNFTTQMEKAKAGYAKVETNIDSIVASLEEHQRTLLKDISTLDQMYKMNLDYFKELSLYIIAGNERLNDYKEREIPAQREKAQNSSDEMALQKLNDMTSLANRFEKKLHDLKLSRIISIQMAPQIRMIQNNNTVLIEKIQSSVVNAIPLWKNQMVIALSMANSRAALQANKKVTEMTNELLLKNSEMLKTGSVEIAKESEEGIVAIETVRKTNENLISTINEVLDIQQKGSQQRAAAEIELQKMEGDLKRALLETSVNRS